MRMSAKRIFQDSKDINISQKGFLGLERHQHGHNSFSSCYGKKENILIAASHFWSDALNAIPFGNRPMTPTPLDVLMLTSLNISANDRTFDLVTKMAHRLITKNVGGQKSHIAEHARTGTIVDTEHTAFLNMWLEKSLSVDQLVDLPPICKDQPKDLPLIKKFRLENTCSEQ